MEHTGVVDSDLSSVVWQPSRTVGTSAASHSPRKTSGRASRTGEVLDLIRLGHVDTVSALAKTMGLARSTVVERLDVLEHIGLLRTDGETAPKRGRPANVLSFNAQAGITLVAQVGMSGTLLAVTDLAAEIVWRRQVQFDVGMGPEKLLEMLEHEFAGALEELYPSMPQIYGVSVGLPGDVEISAAHSPHTAQSGMHRWATFPLAESLRTAFSTPAFVDRDVNLMAMGEQRTAWRDAKVLVSLKVGTVVACGLVINGQVIRGASGMVGEIGHTKVVGGGQPCTCGSRGCLNTVAGGAALAGNLSTRGFSASTARDVAQLANTGAVPAVQAVREAGAHVGDVLASVINLLNPDVVTVWGYLVDAGDQFLAGLQEAVYRQSLPASARASLITRSRLGDDAGLRGAALTAIEHVLSPDAVDELIAARARL